MTSIKERLTEIIQKFAGSKVIVVGDLVADQFVYGDISRVSREAPVLIIRHHHTETLPGAAANCAANLASLGARAILYGVVGDDAAGKSLVDQLKARNVDCHGVQTIAGLTTTTKVRILAGHPNSTRQQVARIDYEGKAELDDRGHERLMEMIAEQAADAVIISDYNYGVASKTLVDLIRTTATDRNFPILIDSRFRLSLFPGFTSATPNEEEVEHLLGRSLDGIADLREAGTKLRERLGFDSLVVTRGGRGMMLFQDHREPEQIDAVGSSEPVDVTGAGDTVIATYALAIAAGASFSNAARIANHCASIVVMKRGTATASARELLSSINY